MENKNYRIIRNYSVAPYNFVSLPSRCIFPYKSYKELPGHDILSDSCLNGYIEYEIVNETPLIVGSSEKEDKIIKPFKNPYGKYAIPGNTIRGVLRNNIAFLSLSSLEEFIEDDRFYFRSFGKGKNDREYRKRLDIGTKIVENESISMPKKIKGGYIYKDSKDKYVLVPSQKVSNNDLSYFIISEQYLRRMHPNVGENYMYNDKILDLITNKDKYKSYDHRINPNKKNLLIKNRNDNYEPYCARISFEIKGIRTVSKIGKPGVYENEGYLMSSEFIQGKLVHYVIPEPDFESIEPKPIEISREKGNFKFIEFYKDDLLRTKKQRKPNIIDKNKDKTYFFLPEKEGKNFGKPIFYGEIKDKLYFGFSPYLRIPYDYSIKDLISEGYKDKSGFSYVDSLFGFTERGEGKEKFNYKSRLSFEDAVCTDESPKLDKIYKLIAGEPHATSYASYLKQDIKYNSDEIKNYNDDDSQIRGIKEYLNKDYWCQEEDGKENVSVYIKPLIPKTTFKGRIYFSNLKREELGLVLWSLKVKDNAYENIGYGKPYGFGRVKVQNINVKTENIRKKYSSMTFDYYKEENKEELINEYKKNFKDKFNIDIDSQATVQDFITLKTLVVDKKHENDARYMKIKFYDNGRKNNEFNMLEPLPDAQEIQKIVKGKFIINKKLDMDQSKVHYKKNKNFKGNGRKNNYNKMHNSNGNNFGLNNSMAEKLEEWKKKYDK